MFYNVCIILYRGTVGNRRLIFLGSYTLKNMQLVRDMNVT